MRNLNTLNRNLGAIETAKTASNALDGQLANKLTEEKNGKRINLVALGVISMGVCYISFELISYFLGLLDK